MKTDEELMLNYRAGQSEAFNELYRRYKKRVYGYLANKIPREQREDVFQQIFLKLHDKRYLYSDEYPFAPWFFTLCRHLIVDHYRKTGKEAQELAELDLSLLGGSEAEDIENDLPPMDEEQYRLLYLKFVEGRGYKELEAEFGSNASTLRKRVSRLLQTLRGGTP